jgi:uncharacterized membrane protein
MAASLDQILIAIQSLTQATQNATNGAAQRAAQNNSCGIITTTIVKSAAGRLTSITVIVAGSTAGAAYDANVTGVTSSPLFIIPATVGIYTVPLIFNYGLVIVPGTGQTVSVFYS